MDKLHYGILSFESTHRAIFSEKILKTEVKVETIPTPREISSECGISIKFNLKDLKTILRMIDKKNLKIDGYYEITKMNNIKSVKEIDLNANEN